jgi:CheY-like chemotaxis protein
VTSASDGLEALQLLRNSSPDTFQLVLTVGAGAASGAGGPRLATGAESFHHQLENCFKHTPPAPLLLLVQDVCMPELNGIELLSCVKQDANLRAVPVVSE